MSEILPRDVLLRIGGRTLHRTGFLAATGAGRGYVEVKETVSRAASSLVIARDGHIGSVGQGLARIEYPVGLLDSSGNPLASLRCDGIITNKLVALLDSSGNPL